MGPALSVKFNDDYNLTFIFLISNFNIQEAGSSGNRTLDYKFTRIDTDIALNYRLNNYFKFFGGVKCLSFETGGPEFNTPGSAGPGMVVGVDHIGFGPGLGLSCTYPITENIFFIGNLSAFYLWTEEKKEYDLPPPTNVKTNCNDIGMNLNLSLAYYIAQASTTISLGGRVQAIKINYKSEYDKHRYGQGDGYDTDTFYGITLTATYSFSI